MVDQSDLDADVLIVGAGTTGLLLAHLLGRSGHRVMIVERHPSRYPLPRAVTFDDEIARILASIGIDSDRDPMIECYDEPVEFRNSRNEILAALDWGGETSAGWSRLYWFHQPELEARLESMLNAFPTVSVRRNVEVLGLLPERDSVSLTCRYDWASDQSRDFALRARYVVGADGANGLVRRIVDLPVVDLGFFFDWLVVDVLPNEPIKMEPAILQCCDPLRPTTVVPGGPGRRRWEFMVLPGEDPEVMNTAEVAWRLLEKWGPTAENSRLERHAVWRFQAKWADCWRSGNVLIAGDAAHLMPPFAGQGMCAGLRDAVNLAWKLDLVLSDRAEPDLLDTFGDERKEHVRQFINLSMEFGKGICVTDPVAAAERDKLMMAARANANFEAEPAPRPSLGEGVWLPSTQGAGMLSPQGYVIQGERGGRFDDVLGQGWTMIGNDLDPQDFLSDIQAELFSQIGGRFVRMTPTGSRGDIFDRDGYYARWFSEIESDFVVIRPDFYLALAATRQSLQDKFDKLMARIKVKKPALDVVVT